VCVSMRACILVRAGMCICMYVYVYECICKLICMYEELRYLSNYSVRLQTVRLGFDSR
jgi:hypothetical protein